MTSNLDIVHMLQGLFANMATPGGGGEDPKKKDAEWTNARIQPNTTAAGQIFSQVGKPMAPTANVSKSMPRESTMTTDTIPAKAVSPGTGRSVENFGIRGEYPEYNRSTHGGAMERDLNAALRDPQGRGTTTPLNHLYQYYGERTPQLLDALEKLSQLRIGGTMAGVDLTKPMKFDVTDDSLNRAGAHNRWSGGISLVGPNVDPSQVGSVNARHTLGHEILHGLLPWAEQNWEGNPYSKFVEQHTSRGNMPVGNRQLVDTTPDAMKNMGALNAVTGKPINDISLGAPVYLAGTRLGEGSGVTGYNFDLDEHRVRAAQLGREMGFHPLFEAIDAGLFENFDPATFDRSALDQLMNSGMDKLFQMYEKGGEGKTSYRQKKWYDTMNQAVQEKLPYQNRNDNVQGQDFYKDLLKRFYMDWASNERPTEKRSQKAQLA